MAPPENKDDGQYLNMEEGEGPPAAFTRQKSSRDGKTTGVLGTSSHFHLQPHEFYQGPHTHDLRAGFIQKVYGILTFQLLVTIGICCMCMFVDGLRLNLINNSRAYFWTFFALLIVSLIVLMVTKNTVPINYISLTVFTATMGFYIGIVCAMYYQIGLGMAVLQALILTTLLFVGLTLFTCITKIDFSFLRYGLFASLWVLILWGLFIPIFGYSSYWLYCLFGVLIFSLFVVYDTSNIMHKFGYDDYIIAAIELYLDFINLFLFILQILGGGRR
ncbi:unnamed protein product [Heterosigma akashiwo]